MKSKSLENIDAAISKGYHLKVFKRFDDKIQATVGLPRSMDAGYHAIGQTREEATSKLNDFLRDVSL